MVAIDAIVAPVVAVYLALVTSILFYFAFALDEEIHSPAVETVPSDATPDDRTEAPVAD